LGKAKDIAIFKIKKLTPKLKIKLNN